MPVGSSFHTVFQTSAYRSPAFVYRICSTRCCRADLADRAPLVNLRFGLAAQSCRLLVPNHRAAPARVPASHATLARGSRLLGVSTLSATPLRPAARAEQQSHAFASPLRTAISSARRRVAALFGRVFDFLLGIIDGVVDLIARGFVAGTDVLDRLVEFLADALDRAVVVTRQKRQDYQPTCKSFHSCLHVAH